MLVGRPDVDEAAASACQPRLLVSHGCRGAAPCTCPPTTATTTAPFPRARTIRWPDGKRLAVCICNNIEIFSFLSGLGSDSAQIGAPQTTRNYAWRDYGNRVGQWYLFDLLDEYGLPASHNFNSLLFDACPQIARAHPGARRRVRSATAAPMPSARTCCRKTKKRADRASRPRRSRAISGARRGWLGPYLAQTPVTLDLLKEAGYDYVLDWPADDQPFWMRTRSGPILSVPYSIELNDSPALVFRQDSARAFER